MKESEDVSKLFAMLGKEKPSEYREIYKADQQQATSERWPLFHAIKLDPAPEGIQVDKTASSKSGASKAASAAADASSVEPSSEPIGGRSGEPLREPFNQWLAAAEGLFARRQAGVTSRSLDEPGGERIGERFGKAVDGSTADSSVTPVIRNEVSQAERAPSENSSNTLQSLFNCLEKTVAKPDRITMAAPIADSDSTPEPKQDSIGSLFKRLGGQ